MKDNQNLKKKTNLRFKNIRKLRTLQLKTSKISDKFRLDKYHRSLMGANPTEVRDNHAYHYYFSIGPGIFLKFLKIQF